MKIEKRGIRITDLPGGVVIDNGDGAIQITGMGDGRTFYPDEAREIRDALSVALGEDAEQTWERIEDVPESVPAVRDKDGDPWSRQKTDGDNLFAGETFEWINQYAPFRRA